MIYDTRTECVSAEDSSTHSSTTSSRRPKQLDKDDVIQGVSQLPETVVNPGLSSGIIERLTKKKQGQHDEVLKHLNEELSHISSVCKDEVQSVCQQLLNSLQDRNHQLETLKVSMEVLRDDNREAGALWQQIEQKTNLTKENIVELKVKLSDCDRRQMDQIACVLKKCCEQLVYIGLMPLPDLHRLIHAEAMKVNQSLLANRRSVAQLVLRLQEENLQKEAQLRLLWEEHLHYWRWSQATQVAEKFRSLFSRNQEQQHHQLTELTHLSQQRSDIISSISSLVPPTCSTELVSDWFDLLTAINQQIDHFHNEHLHLLQCECEEAWKDLRAEAELSTVALFDLQLPDEDVNDFLRSQFLPLIEQRQSEDEERLAALKVHSDTDAQNASHLSSHVLSVMQGMALLWETHCCRLKEREEELQRDVDELRHSRHQSLQEHEERLKELMEEISHQGSEDDLRAALDNTAHFLQELKLSHEQCVPDQWRLVDRLPSLHMDELQIYSSNISKFFHLRDTYWPSSEDLEKLQLLFSNCLDQESADFLVKPTGKTLDDPISRKSPAQDSQDWLLELCDISTEVTFTTSRGVVYSGPAFRSPSHNLPEPHLSQFPEDLLTHTLDRFRLQFLENLEHHFLSILESAVTTVTQRREAVQSEEQVYMQKLDLEHIKSQVFQPRLEELQLHRQHVVTHRQSVANILTSCRKELTDFQASIGTKNQQLKIAVSELEQDTLSANSIKRLKVLSAALHDITDQHVTDTNTCYESFRDSVSVRLEEERTEISELLNSFRLFSDGGKCTPEELDQLHMELEEGTQQMEDAEKNIYSELKTFMFRNRKEVKQTSAPLQEKLAVQESEDIFNEKTQKLIRSTNILITAEVARCNQQQFEISKQLVDLSRSIEDTEASPVQTLSLLSSLVSKLNTRCQYLDLKNLSLAASDPLQPPRKSVSKVSLKESAQSEGGNSAVQPPRKVSKSVNSKRGRRKRRIIRTNVEFQIFGSSPDSGSSSFASVLNTLLWSANDILLLNCEDFYNDVRGSSSLLQLLPDTAEQWVESMHQSLLDYQEKGIQCEISSRAELVKQLFSLGELLQSLPSALIGYHERQLEAELREAVGGPNQRLEEVLTVSEKEKAKVLRDIRPFMTSDELESLKSVELHRQQQVEDTICRVHLELQECVQGLGEEFATSLSSLMEQLLSHVGQLTCDVTKVSSNQDAEGVAMEAKSDPQQCSSPSVTTTTTVSNKKNKLSLRVQEEKDAAVKRFQQLVDTELSLSERNKRRQLSQQQCWRQEILTLSTQLCESS